MNDMTYVQSDHADLARTQTHFLTEQLGYLWLLSALESGMKQAKRGETIVADKAFFDGLQAKLFAEADEEVIQA